MSYKSLSDSSNNIANNNIRKCGSTDCMRLNQVQVVAVPRKPRQQGQEGKCGFSSSRVASTRLQQNLYQRKQSQNHVLMQSESHGQRLSFIRYSLQAAAAGWGLPSMKIGVAPACDLRV